MLREQRQLDAAEELRRGELAAALAEIRPQVDSDAALEQKLDTIFAAEAERVANAAVLAELLAPLVAQKLQSPAPDAFALASQVSAEPEQAPAAAPGRPAPPPRGDPADLAHFIDEMIAQERAAPRGAPARRAS